MDTLFFNENSKFGPTDRDEGSKSRSSKSESSESRTKPEAKHDAKTDESILRPETFSSKDESSSSAASDKGKIYGLQDQVSYKSKVFRK